MGPGQRTAKLSSGDPPVRHEAPETNHAPPPIAPGSAKYASAARDRAASYWSAANTNPPSASYRQYSRRYWRNPSHPTRAPDTATRVVNDQQSGTPEGRPPRHANRMPGTVRPTGAAREAARIEPVASSRHRPLQPDRRMTPRPRLQYPTAIGHRRRCPAASATQPPGDRECENQCDSRHQALSHRTVTIRWLPPSARPFEFDAIGRSRASSWLTCRF